MLIRLNHKVINETGDTFIPAITLLNTNEITRIESVNYPDMVLSGSDSEKVEAFCIEVYYRNFAKPQTMWFETAEKAAKTISLIERVGNKEFYTNDPMDVDM